MGQKPTSGLRSTNHREKKSLWSIQVYNFICPCSVSGPSWGCYWSACPVLITWLAGTTTGPGAQGLWALEKRYQVNIQRGAHKHRSMHARHCANTKTLTTANTKEGTDTCCLTYVYLQPQNTDSPTQAFRPRCSGTELPSRSLAPDCQGELRKNKWHVVFSSARCAADTADRHRHFSNSHFSLISHAVMKSSPFIKCDQM